MRSRLHSGNALLPASLRRRVILRLGREAIETCFDAILDTTTETYRREILGKAATSKGISVSSSLVEDEIKKAAERARRRSIIGTCSSIRTRRLSARTTSDHVSLRSPDPRGPTTTRP